MKGRKRHILVDTLGLIQGLVVHEGNIQDSDGAKLVFWQTKGQMPRLLKVWADQGYAGKLIAWVQEKLNVTLEIVKRPHGLKAFVVLPKRWIVERSFAWLGNDRRLSKDYELCTKSSEGFIWLSALHRMNTRLAG